MTSKPSYDDLIAFAQGVAACRPGEHEEPSSADQETLTGLAADARSLLGYMADLKRDTRYHSSDDMSGLGEFRGVTEPVAVVLRFDGSVDAYGYLAVIDQRR